MRRGPEAEASRRTAAGELVTELQRRQVSRLERAARTLGLPVELQPVHWQRDEGRHGGGTRFQAGGLEAPEPRAFDQASVNVSQVHYDDLPHKRLASATALSAIVHPWHPRAPSMHLHVSWTSLRTGRATWRIMADLNPSLPDPAQTDAFRAVLRQRAGALFAEGSDNGDRYFTIPALGRTRGVAHFYLEGHDSGDFEADLALARSVEEGVIDAYGDLVEQALVDQREPTAQERAEQLAYHTLYIFQVLTLDRGTTSGLLVHADNDLGILGSLPTRLDPKLLASWAERVPTLQRPLVEALASALPPAEADGAVRLDTATRRRLAQTVRAHYQAHPEALALQARGSVVPPTVSNHGSSKGA